jgi:hypothetical protein
MMARRAEKIFRSMAGMPPPPGRKERRERERRRTEESGRRGAYGRRRGKAPVAEMRDVAEDVEYTEIKEYSSDTVIAGEGPDRQRRVYREEQVSDAEYVMVRDRENKKH